MKQPHPSGRPIRKPQIVRNSLYRVPRRDYETPRLNERSPTDAIGFRVEQLPGHQDYRDDEDRKR
jgi:hypothetical protein